MAPIAVSGDGRFVLDWGSERRVASLADWRGRDLT
jgi:hypothetical protein